MGKLENNKQQKRTSLLDTAFKLFTTQGVSKTSIAEISQKAGIAKGTFYLYFKDKLEGINWTDSNDEPVISLIASDASYLYFMYNGIYSSYFDAENPMNNSPLYRYISDVFIHEWKLSINDDVIVKIKFKEKS